MLLKNSTSTIVPWFGFWSNLERWKSLMSGCLMNWMKIKFKKSSFWSVVFSYSMQQQWTISQIDWDMWWKVDFIWQLAMTSSVVGSRSSKALPNTKLAPKKLWLLFGGLLPVLSTTAFWVPVKLLHLRSMLSKSIKCTENCNGCIQHWSTEWSHFSMMMPDHMFHNQCFKTWTNWAAKFCLILRIQLPLTNRLPHLKAYRQLFAENAHLQSAGGRKCFPSVHQIPKDGFLHYRNKHLFLSGKNALIVMVPILVNKHVFEPS